MDMKVIPSFPMQEDFTTKLAQAVVPYQKYRELFDCQKALYQGTIFKELYKPYIKMKPYK